MRASPPCRFSTPRPHSTRFPLNRALSCARFARAAAVAGAAIAIGASSPASALGTSTTTTAPSSAKPLGASTAPAATSTPAGKATAPAGSPFAGKATPPPSSPAATGATGATGAPLLRTPTAPATGATGTPLLRTSTAPAAATGAAAPGARAIHHGGGGLSTLAIVLAVLGALLVLGCAAWALARYRALEPHWWLDLRHATAEAGFRASSTWAEFADWARLGH